MAWAKRSEWRGKAQIELNIEGRGWGRGEVVVFCATFMQLFLVGQGPLKKPLATHYHRG